MILIYIETGIEYRSYEVDHGLTLTGKTYEKREGNVVDYGPEPSLLTSEIRTMREAQHTHSAVCFLTPIEKEEPKEKNTETEIALQLSKLEDRVKYLESIHSLPVTQAR